MPIVSRYLTVTQGNLDNNHLYLTEVLDFFPEDVFGGPDVTQGTNAIMRCAKDLGVARNLWLPAWCRRWLVTYCEIIGTVGKSTKVWARKDDEAGHDALAFAIDERAAADRAAADTENADAHLDAIATGGKKKSADMHARNAAKKMQMATDLEDNLRSQKIDEDIAAEHDGWEEEGE